jgi:hypothetical protein
MEQGLVVRQTQVTPEVVLDPDVDQGFDCYEVDESGDGTGYHALQQERQCEDEQRQLEHGFTGEQADDEDGDPVCH